jgi:hypothetical protein
MYIYTCVTIHTCVYSGYLVGAAFWYLITCPIYLCQLAGIQGWWWGKVRVWEAEDLSHCTQLVVVDSRSPWRFAAHLQIASGTVQSAVVLCLGLYVGCTLGVYVISLTASLPILYGPVKKQLVWCLPPDTCVRTGITSHNGALVTTICILHHSCPF